jgi:hypothetical protein
MDGAIVALILLAALIFAVRVAIRLRQLSRGSEVTDVSLAADFARGWHKFQVKRKAAEAVSRQAWADRQQERLSRRSEPFVDQAVTHAARAKQWVEENAARIQQEREQARFAAPPARKASVHPDAAALAAAHREIAELKAQLAEVERRQPRGSAPSTAFKRPHIDYDRNGPKQVRGARAVFVYADANGEVTDREITNWSISGQRFSGFCLLRYEVRTFRLDQVLEWRHWE